MTRLSQNMSNAVIKIFFVLSAVGLAGFMAWHLYNNQNIAPINLPEVNQPPVSVTSVDVEFNGIIVEQSSQESSISSIDSSDESTKQIASDKSSSFSSSVTLKSSISSSSETLTPVIEETEEESFEILSELENSDLTKNPTMDVEQDDSGRSLLYENQDIMCSEITQTPESILKKLGKIPEPKRSVTFFESITGSPITRKTPEEKLKQSTDAGDEYW